MDPGGRVYEVLSRLASDDPADREEALHDLVRWAAPEHAAVVQDVLWCVALVDADLDVAGLAVGLAVERRRRGLAPTGYAALLPIAPWFGDVRAYEGLGDGAPPDPAVWTRLVPRLCGFVTHRTGTTRSNALAVLRRLVADGHLPDADVPSVAALLRIQLLVRPDAEVARVVAACTDRVPGPDALPRPPPPCVPPGWNELPDDLRPAHALAHPRMCAACRHVHPHPPVLCARCGNWTFVEPGTPIPPATNAHPTPPAWVVALREIQRTPPVTRARTRPAHRPRDGGAGGDPPG